MCLSLITVWGLTTEWPTAVLVINIFEDWRDWGSLTCFSLAYGHCSWPYRPRPIEPVRVPWAMSLARYIKKNAGCASAGNAGNVFTATAGWRSPHHHGTCVRHAPRCLPGSPTSDFPWSWWRGKRSRHSRRSRNPQFDVSGKRPMESNDGVIPHEIYLQNLTGLHEAWIADQSKRAFGTITHKPCIILLKSFPQNYEQFVI